MTPEEADNLLSNNDWSTWGDARHLLMLAYSIGYRNGVDSLNQTQISLPHKVEQQSHQPTNAQDAAAGNTDAIRHIAYAEGYSDGKAMMKQQRDELLALLKRALPQLIGPAYQSAVRALAKAEGDQ
jgi:hypothetical protein